MWKAPSSEICPQVTKLAATYDARARRWRRPTIAPPCPRNLHDRGREGRCGPFPMRIPSEIVALARHEIARRRRATAFLMTWPSAGGGRFGHNRRPPGPLGPRMSLVIEKILVWLNTSRATAPARRNPFFCNSAVRARGRHLDAIGHVWIALVRRDRSPCCRAFTIVEPPLLPRRPAPPIEGHQTH